MRRYKRDRFKKINRNNSRVTDAFTGKGGRRKVESREKLCFVKYGKIAVTVLEKHIYADAKG